MDTVAVVPLPGLDLISNLPSSNSARSLTHQRMVVGYDNTYGLHRYFSAFIITRTIPHTNLKREITSL
jgi:hypothetical protein